MKLHPVTPIYFSYFQESFLWFKNKTGDAQGNSTHSKQHQENVPDCKDDNIKQYIS